MTNSIFRFNYVFRQECPFFCKCSWSPANGNDYLTKVVCYRVINACRNEKFPHGCESSFDCLKRFIHQKTYPK